MLQKLSEHATDCLNRAADAERRAAKTADSALQADNERMAQAWRHLARSYQFVDSLECFLLGAEKARASAARRPTYFSPMGAVFDPEALTLLSAAYEKALDGQPAALCETIAKRILELAAEGERDPDKLSQGALALSIRGPRWIA